MMIEKQIYDPLITRDPETGEFVGRLATEWEWIDETHLSLTLREGVKWHDRQRFHRRGCPLHPQPACPKAPRPARLYTAFDPENSTSDGDYQVTIASRTRLPLHSLLNKPPCVHRLEGLL